MLTFFREAVAEKEFFDIHIPTLKYISDLLTKVNYSHKRQILVKGLLCDIYYHDRDELNWLLFCRFLNNVRKLTPMG